MISRRPDFRSVKNWIQREERRLGSTLPVARREFDRSLRNGSFSNALVHLIGGSGVTSSKTIDLVVDELCFLFFRATEDKVEEIIPLNIKKYDDYVIRQVYLERLLDVDFFKETIKPTAKISDYENEFKDKLRKIFGTNTFSTADEAFDASKELQSMVSSFTFSDGRKLAFHRKNCIEITKAHRLLWQQQRKEGAARTLGHESDDIINAKELLQKLPKDFAELSLVFDDGWLTPPQTIFLLKKIGFVEIEDKRNETKIKEAIEANEKTFINRPNSIFTKIPHLMQEEPFVSAIWIDHNHWHVLRKFKNNYYVGHSKETGFFTKYTCIENLFLDFAMKKARFMENIIMLFDKSAPQPEEIMYDLQTGEGNCAISAINMAIGVPQFKWGDVEPLVSYYDENLKFEKGHPNYPLLFGEEEQGAILKIIEFYGFENKTINELKHLFGEDSTNEEFISVLTAINKNTKITDDNAHQYIGKDEAELKGIYKNLKTKIRSV